MKTANFSPDETRLIFLALATFRAHHEQEAKAMADFAKDETFDQATRDQCGRNVAAGLEFVRRATALLDTCDPSPAREIAAAGACQEEEAEEEARFLNHYKCERCSHEWQDEWSCAVDDDCPACGARHMTPHTSEELEAA